MQEVKSVKARLSQAGEKVFELLLELSTNE